MWCPECQTTAIRVRQLLTKGYDPTMTEWECKNPICKLTFYTTRPPWNPPLESKDPERITAAQARAILAGQAKLV